MTVFNFKNLRTDNEQFGWFLFDVFMVLLAIVNINLIIFDFTFSYDVARSFYQSLTPAFFEWYDTNIHFRFIFIDLVFVSIFFVEFLIRWIIAIKNNEYRSWIVFPFARWYDILGLIPIGTFRFLRVLRIISISFRLNKMGVLNLRELMERSGLKRYYDIFIEEISDRVVVNVLNSAQGRVYSNDEIIKDIVVKVVKPNNERLVQYSMQRVQHITRDVFGAHKDEIRKYIFKKVNDAVDKNKEMNMLGSVPGLGGIIKKQLESAIGDITYQVIAGLVEDVATGNDVFSKEIPAISENILNSFENDAELENMLKDIVNLTIEIIKERVLRKQWASDLKN
jgi:hypothetical protein